jgi:hypothetical protein
MLAMSSSSLQQKLIAYTDAQEKEVMEKVEKLKSVGWENY